MSMLSDMNCRWFQATSANELLETDGVKGTIFLLKRGGAMT